MAELDSCQTEFCEKSHNLVWCRKQQKWLAHVWPAQPVFGFHLSYMCESGFDAFANGITISVRDENGELFDLNGSLSRIWIWIGNKLNLSLYNVLYECLAVRSS